MGMLEILYQLIPPVVSTNKKHLIPIYMQRYFGLTLFTLFPFLGCQFFAEHLFKAIRIEERVAELAQAYLIVLLPQFFFGIILFLILPISSL